MPPTKLGRFRAHDEDSFSTFASVEMAASLFRRAESRSARAASHSAQAAIFSTIIMLFSNRAAFRFAITAISYSTIRDAIKHHLVKI
jgi:hypothetical protein